LDKAADIEARRSRRSKRERRNARAVGVGESSAEDVKSDEDYPDHIRRL
jgi:hypothetical protein